MNNKSLHIQVAGRVQGVAFRHYTKIQADQLGVTGWVRNRPDGSVEAVISGTERQLEDMVAWLHSGPPAAVVNAVQVTETAEPDIQQMFDIRY